VDPDYKTEDGPTQPRLAASRKDYRIIEQPTCYVELGDYLTNLKLLDSNTNDRMTRGHGELQLSG
jgi:hypothetical protein